MTTLLVVNPTAGGGHALLAVPSVRDVLLAQGHEVVVVETNSADHAEEVAGAAGVDDLVVSLGGDGLHGRVAAGAVCSGALLAPIPAGRGNDLVRALGISADPIVATRQLAVATERRIDVGLAGDRVFLGVASVGFDTVANTIANETTWLRGPLVYGVAGTRALLSTKLHQFTVTVDGETVHFLGRNVAVGNSGRYGGGMRICPDARLDDGLLDVVAATAIPKWDFPSVLLGAFNGSHLSHPRVHSRTGVSVRIEADTPLVVFADGDPIGTLPMTITTRPAALRVLC